MKFGKHFQSASYEPWREHYVSYHKLKRVLNKLKVEIKEAQQDDEMNGDGISLNGSILSGNAGSNEANGPMPLIVPVETKNEVLELIDSDIDKINSFFNATLLEITNELHRIQILCGVSPTPPRLPLPSTSATTSASTSVNLIDVETRSSHTASFLDSSNGNNGGRKGSNSTIETPITNNINNNNINNNNNNNNNKINTNANTLLLNIGDTNNNNNIIINTTNRTNSFNNINNNNNNNNYQTTSTDSFSSFRISEAQSIGSLSVSASVMSVANREQLGTDLIALYRKVIHLKSFCDLNKEAFLKIMKKFDKVTGERSQNDFSEKLSKEDFTNFFEYPQLLQDIELLFKAQESIVLSQSTVKSMGALGPMLSTSRDIKVIVRQLEKEETRKSYIAKRPWKIHYLLLAFFVGLIILVVPFWPDDKAYAHRCLALLSTVTILWVTEAIPFFVTALAIAPATVLLEILSESTTSSTPCVNGTNGDSFTSSNLTTLTAEAAAGKVFTYMFDHTSALILGGFSISAAFSKFQYELWIAAFIQRYVGHKPKLFLLCFMFLGLLLSLLIGNVAAPILCSGIMLPIIRDLNRNSLYAKAMLLGLAFACNIGGMLTPVSSPQNAVVVNVYPIDFGDWVTVSFPFCIVATVCAWAFLILSIKPNDVERIPKIVWEKKPLRIDSIVVLVVSFVTVILWSTLTVSKEFFGDMGVVAFLPVVVFFSTGILTKNDFNTFQWNLIFLIGGGSVLGQAVKNSQLLHLVADAIEPSLKGNSLWVTMVAIAAFVLIVSSFVSHTVAAIILMPVVTEIAEGLGNTQILVLAAGFMDSASMALPMTSFPNVNALLTQDDFERNYLTPFHFLKYGGPFSIFLLLLMGSWGYLLLWAKFG